MRARRSACSPPASLAFTSGGPVGGEQHRRRIADHGGPRRRQRPRHPIGISSVNWTSPPSSSTASIGTTAGRLGSTRMTVIGLRPRRVRTSLYQRRLWVARQERAGDRPPSAAVRCRGSAGRPPNRRRAAPDLNGGGGGAVPRRRVEPGQADLCGVRQRQRRHPQRGCRSGSGGGEFGDAVVPTQQAQPGDGHQALGGFGQRPVPVDEFVDLPRRRRARRPPTPGAGRPPDEPVAADVVRRQVRVHRQVDTDVFSPPASSPSCRRLPRGRPPPPRRPGARRDRSPPRRRGLTARRRARRCAANLQSFSATAMPAPSSLFCDSGQSVVRRLWVSGVSRDRGRA